MRAQGMELYNAVWLQGKSCVASTRKWVLVYDLAPLGEVVELEVLDVEAIFQDCAVILLPT